MTHIISKPLLNINAVSQRDVFLIVSIPPDVYVTH
jgi:hypothetical protein